MTTVGPNGGASFDGAFDMSGNMSEWNDLTGTAGLSRGRLGGAFNVTDPLILSSFTTYLPYASEENLVIGFRLASADVAPIPEPGTWAAMAIFADGAALRGLAPSARRSSVGERADERAARPYLSQQSLKSLGTWPQA